jgi:hypothetical protein
MPSPRRTSLEGASRLRPFAFFIWALLLSPLCVLSVIILLPFLVTSTSSSKRSSSSDVSSLLATAFHPVRARSLLLSITTLPLPLPPTTHLPTSSRPIPTKLLPFLTRTTAINPTRRALSTTIQASMTRAATAEATGTIPLTETTALTTTGSSRTPCPRATSLSSRRTVRRAETFRCRWISIRAEAATLRTRTTVREATSEERVARTWTPFSTASASLASRAESPSLWEAHLAVRRLLFAPFDAPASELAADDLLLRFHAVSLARMVMSSVMKTGPAGATHPNSQSSPSNNNSKNDGGSPNNYDNSGSRNHAEAEALDALTQLAQQPEYVQGGAGGNGAPNSGSYGGGNGGGPQSNEHSRSSTGAVGRKKIRIPVLPPRAAIERLLEVSRSVFGTLRFESRTDVAACFYIRPTSSTSSSIRLRCTCRLSSSR